MSGEAELDEMVARIRRLPEAVKATAPALADVLKGELTRTIAAGTTPDGAGWQRKKDGGRPLVNAAAALTVRAHGTTIVATITGPEVFHHYGTKKDPKRQILPEGAMPATVADAFRAKMVETFRRTMGGR